IGVPYSADNVPYQPKSYLKISLEGISPGDFTFVMGYPGRTFRNFTSGELLNDIEDMRRSLLRYQAIADFYEQSGENSRDIQIKYASTVRGFYNAMKNYRGKLQGIEENNLVELKKEKEQGFRKWISQSAGRREKYGDVLQELEQFLPQYEKDIQKEQQLSRLVQPRYGPALLWQAHLIYRTVQERTKPDTERESRYQDRNLPELRESVELAERRYDLQTDRNYFEFILSRMQQDTSGNVPEVVQSMVKGKTRQEISEWVERLYQQTILTDPAKRLELLEKTPAELEKLNDPLIELAARIEKRLKELRENNRTRRQEFKELKRTWLAGMLEMREGRMAPDANSTIRFTSGTVKGYSPRDGVYYLPQTTLSGVIAKNTGEPPFDVPEELIRLWESKNFGRYADQQLNDVPACFLNTTAVTGGNSGSPTLNARGEQVGIIFDMTYESVIGDYHIIPELQRTISVDIRYVLFITEKFSGATRIIEELNL
ncbi:MAG: S46 family peptidase, partial [Calditrichia bacterium]